MAEKARIPRPKGGSRGPEYAPSPSSRKGENAKFSANESPDAVGKSDNHGPSFPKGKSGERASFVRRGPAFPKKREPSVKRVAPGTAGRQSG